MTKNNALVSGLTREQFRLKIMVPQIAKETPKISEGLPFSLPVSIQEKKRTRRKDAVGIAGWN